MHEGVEANTDVEHNDRVIGARRQVRIQVALLIHEQDLQDQRDRHHARDELLRSAGPSVKVPDQPDELDQRDNKDQIAETDDALELIGAHVRHRSV
jgi:hypothetical protein